jgi:hypothetical protein
VSIDDDFDTFRNMLLTIWASGSLREGHTGANRCKIGHT